VRILAADEEKVAFWRRHTLVGVALCVVLPAIVALDTWLTPDPVNAPARYALSVGVAAPSLLLLLVPVDRVVRHRYGRLFFDVWEAAGLALVLGIALLDGGGTSPYLHFLYVLLAHAALAYPPAGMVVAGGVAVAGYLGVAWLGAADVPAHALLTGILTLGMTTAICAFASHNHVLAYRRTATRARRVARLAELDGLTGCLHNRAFHERLAQVAGTASPQGPASLVVLDVDHFKAVNDQHGHPAGDAVLEGVGAVLRAATRTGDVAGRLGGDEFALLLPHTGADEAYAVAQRVRADITRVTVSTPITVSVGVATWDRSGDGSGLLAAADRAVYDAKRGGRDRVSALAPEAARDAVPDAVPSSRH
jgi:diguanylate cyclase (GGDEF)-like protein